MLNKHQYICRDISVLDSNIMRYLTLVLLVGSGQRFYTLNLVEFQKEDSLGIYEILHGIWDQ